MSKFVGYTPYAATIAEMTDDGSISDFVKLDPKLAKDIVDPKDDEPVFVTIEVLNEGVSRNGRKWTKELIASVAEQINSKKVDGYRGHLTDSERSHKAPQAETIWLGAVVKEVNGKLRLFAKGYVLPSAKHLRSYLRSAKVAGKNVAVSVYGTASKAVKDAAGNMSFSDFNLESVDWARPGSEGVQNMGIFAVTAEMTDSNNPKEDIVNREDTIKDVKKSELEALNPAIIQEIKDEARQAIEAEQGSVVAEMTSIKEIVGDSPVETIAEMKRVNRELQLDNDLREKVEMPAARKFVRNMVVSEMETDTETPVSEMVDKALASEEAKAVVREQLETPPAIAPTIERPTLEARRFTKVVQRSK